MLLDFRPVCRWKHKDGEFAGQKNFADNGFLSVVMNESKTFSDAANKAPFSSSDQPISKAVETMCGDRNFRKGAGTP
jgi:hypothetical protein